MTQRNVELVIGRLLTDEEFRQKFLVDPQRSLHDLLEHGTQLTALEVAALLATDMRLWNRVANQIDARLQKGSLKAPRFEAGTSGSCDDD